MATTYTPNANLGKPGVGDAGWGATLNTTLDTIDAMFTPAGLTPNSGGGTGADSSAWTGAVRVDAGVWSATDTLTSYPWWTPYGLTLSNGTDATNDINIAVGDANSDDVTPTDRIPLVLTGALTKQLDAAWAVGTAAGGRDTGAIANGTWHVFLIKRVDTGVVDVLFSQSATAPTMPANYTKKRRIGSILRESAAIVAFSQQGNSFIRSVSVLDYSGNNPGTARLTIALSVPTGIVVDAQITALLIGTVANSTAVFSSLVASDQAPSASAAPLHHTAYAVSGGGGNIFIPTALTIRTNASMQISSRLSASAASNTLYIVTTGWVDPR